MTARLERLRSWAAAVPAPPPSRAPRRRRPSIRTVSGVAQGTTYSLQWTGGATEPEIALGRRAGARAHRRACCRTIAPTRRSSSSTPRVAPSRSSCRASSSRCSTLRGASTTRATAASIRRFGRSCAPGASTATRPRSRRRRPSTRRARASASTSSSCSTRRTYARRVAALEIDMASIGQGYTAGRLADAARAARQHGLSGRDRRRDRGARREAGRLRLAHRRREPRDGAHAGPALRMPPAARTAVITSGSYRQYFEADGRRFGHIIDPRTGWPVEHALLSVTVVGPDAATAAAWGTALLCLGPGERRRHGRARESRRLALGRRATASRDPGAAARAFASEWQELLDEPRGR